MKQIGFAFYLLCISLPVHAVDDIVLWKRNFDKPFFYELLHLAAQLSEPEFGEYTITPSVGIEQGRAFHSLHDGELLNVIIAGISSNRERMGLPIYVPLDRGLLGFRVCLQRAESSAYIGVNSLQDLQKAEIYVGVGSHWPDRQILEKNGLKVMHSPVYEHLFSMLQASRFDCLLRSLNEVEYELSREDNALLKVESAMAIVYPQADFMFVSINNKRIKERLELGLTRAIESGVFFELFDAYYAQVLRQYQLYERKIIFLENSDLSAPAMDAINKYGLASFAIGR